MSRKLSGLVAALAALALTCVATGSHAQAWPTRSVRLVVPYATGGSTDSTARLIAKELSVRLGQPFVVDNRAGAGGSLGHEQVAKSPADGYTLLFSAAGPLTVTPHTYAKLGYDPIKAFAPIKLIAKAPLVLVVNPNFPARSVKELVAEARAQPGKLTYASFGNGSAAHLAGELFKSTEGLDITHIPYKGSAPALTDLLAGQVPMMFDVVVTSLPHIQAGKLRALAITSPERLAVLPDVPTMAEAGIPNFDASTWFGVLAPAGTPPAVIDKLSKALDAALAEPEVRKLLASQGAVVGGGTPEDFKAFFLSEYDKWGKVVASAGVRAE